MQQQLEQRASKIHSLSLELDAAVQKYNKQKMHADELRTHNNLLNLKLDKMQRDYESVISQRNSLESDINRLNEELAITKQELDHLKEQHEQNDSVTREQTNDEQFKALSEQLKNSQQTLLLSLLKVSQYETKLQEVTAALERYCFE